MDVLTTEALTSISLHLLFYFIVGTLGAFTKDLYETMTKKIEKIRLGEVIVGGIVAAIICYGLSDTWLKNFSLNTMFLITFVIGVLGFELFGNMTNIAKIRNLLIITEEIRRGIINPEQTPSSNTNLEDKSDASQMSRGSDEVNADAADINTEQKNNTE